MISACRLKPSLRSHSLPLQGVLAGALARDSMDGMRQNDLLADLGPIVGGSMIVKI